MTSNVVVLPSFGKAITLDDQGLYYAVNTAKGTIHSVFQLVYEDEWYLYQLQEAHDEDGYYWTMLQADADFALNSMTTEEIRHHFNKPQYAEPVGGWQVIRNSKFGFGKFTPLTVHEAPSYALLQFDHNEMHSPILIHKADDDFLMQPATSMHQTVEFA